MIIFDSGPRDLCDKPALCATISEFYTPEHHEGRDYLGFARFVMAHSEYSRRLGQFYWEGMLFRDSMSKGSCTDQCIFPFMANTLRALEISGQPLVIEAHNLYKLFRKRNDYTLLSVPSAIPPPSSAMPLPSLLSRTRDCVDIKSDFFA